MTEQATTPTAKDWREFVEPVTKNYELEILCAMPIDGRWHGFARNSAGEIFSVFPRDFMLKPKPKTTRPWTPDEVPVGCVVKNKATGAKAVILSSDDPTGAWIAGSGWNTYRKLHDNFFLELTRPSGSTPGSYGVCGVEE